MAPPNAEAAADEAAGDEAPKLKTEFDTFRDSKGAASADIRIQVRNESKAVEFSSPELLDATLQSLHLSEKVPPGHEEGFYLKKGKGKMEGRLVLHATFPDDIEGTLTFSWPQSDDSESVVPRAAVEYKGRVAADMTMEEGAGDTVQENCMLGECVFTLTLAPDPESFFSVVIGFEELGCPPKLRGYDWDVGTSLFRSRRLVHGIDAIVAPMDASLGPPVWAVKSGALPNGLNLNPETGSITGTPIEAGAFSCVISVSNLAGESTTSLQLHVTMTEAEKRKALAAATDNLVQEARGALQLPCSPPQIEAAYGRALNTASAALADNLNGLARIEIDTWLMELLGVMSKLVADAKKVNAELIGRRPGLTIQVPRHRPSVQEALDALPPHGGIVQIAPGIYKEDVNVTLPAILMGPEEEGASAAVIEGTLTIADGGENSVLRRLELRARRLGAPALCIRAGAPRIEACDISGDAGPSVVVSGSRTNPRIVRNLVRYPPHGPGGINISSEAKARCYDNVLRTLGPGPEHIGCKQQERNIVSTPDPLEVGRQQQALQQQQYLGSTTTSWSNASFSGGSREIHSREAQSQSMSSTISSVWQHRVMTPSTDGLRRTLSDLGRSLAAQPREERVPSAPIGKAACRAAARASSQCNLPRPGRPILKRRVGEGLVPSSISFEVPSPMSKSIGGAGRPFGENQFQFRPF
eukprot:gnl/MRDRNA2_/MRDRNA2_29151_c0_seq1.p1 gnl/MRDRNA2_/MRDRNA2_29151_c0~~gnl/MRDRNA2_/MRDRNA2_29151_c0_seq1.p1  ORF type:complete len:698 (-),score=144.39 gnl/MRDRNA2_/MRDRNA2_29151_c0_seq1:47-2140(-)